MQTNSLADEWQISDDSDSGHGKRRQSIGPSWCRVGAGLGWGQARREKDWLLRTAMLLGAVSIAAVQSLTPQGPSSAQLNLWRTSWMQTSCTYTDSSEEYVTHSS